MTTDDIKSLRILLHRMREEDPSFRVSGADIHKYSLGPPLSESALLSFEQQYSVTLPPDFRSFLMVVGDGGVTRSSAPFLGRNSGAGPGCGVMPLDETIVGCDLGRPFPLTESVAGQPLSGTELWGSEEDFPGVLEICYHGGGEFAFLVVNGPSYSTVWNADIEVNNFHPSHPSFDDWYYDWIRGLEEFALPRLASERRVAGVKVGMTKTEVLALCGEDWEQKSSSFGKSHLAFKQLSTEFKLDEEEVVVRIIAHSIYWHHGSRYQPS